MRIHGLDRHRLVRGHHVDHAQQAARGVSHVVPAGTGALGLAAAVVDKSSQLAFGVALQAGAAGGGVGLRAGCAGLLVFALVFDIRGQFACRVV
ncbi:hypothetical protein D3C77_689890 [compost metagenome]